jgi:hypothetical protein
MRITSSVPLRGTMRRTLGRCEIQSTPVQFSFRLPQNIIRGAHHHFLRLYRLPHQLWDVVLALQCDEPLDLVLGHGVDGRRWTRTAVWREEHDRALELVI